MSQITKITMLSIEIDGHFHGSPEVPKPWVAEIQGPCPRFGLKRSFVQNLNDWKGAHVANSGNLYGVVARFPLRSGRLYEVSRLRGTSSRRYVSREFVALSEDGKRKRIDPEEALSRACGTGTRFELDEPDKAESKRTWVARVTGLGTPTRLGFIVDNHKRVYLLSRGLYEVADLGNLSFVAADGGTVARIDSEKEALQWLSENHSH